MFRYIRKDPSTSLYKAILKVISTELENFHLHSVSSSREVPKILYHFHIFFQARTA